MNGEDHDLRGLAEHQRAALAHVRELGARGQGAGRAALEDALRRAGVETNRLDEACLRIRAHGQVAIHFHPERLCNTGRSVAEGLLADGVYKSQFETGISSGATSAYPGGTRDLWEKVLFGGAYHTGGFRTTSRPLYGSLAIMDHADGPSPRFGSSYLLLRPEVSRRTTLTFGGSQEDDALERSGTFDTLEPVLASLVAHLERDGGALGVDGLTVSRLFLQLTSALGGPFRDPSTRPLGRALDSFVEAQIHGTLRLEEDVDRIVIDPSFRGTQTENVLAAVAARHCLPLHWHPGYVLSTRLVPEHFRGYEIRSLADGIAKDGTLDAATLGAAANALEPRVHDGPCEERDELLTRFRRLWHVLVLEGAPNLGSPDCDGVSVA